jgi:hypothetical protein
MPDLLNVHGRSSSSLIASIQAVISLSFYAEPFEPPVKDIIFTRIPGGDCTSPAFCQHGTRTFSHGGTIVVVGASTRRNSTRRQSQCSR